MTALDWCDDKALPVGFRCITVRQPWHWSIRPGGKTIENRGRGALHWSYRGMIGLHAGLGWSPRGQHDDRVRALANVPGLGRGQYAHALDQDTHTKTPPPFVTGAVTGVASLVDIHPGMGCCHPWGEDDYTRADGTTEWHVAHLVLEDILEFDEPIDCRGFLGLWTPPEATAWDILVAAIEANWAGLNRPDHLC